MRQLETPFAIIGRQLESWVISRRRPLALHLLFFQTLSKVVLFHFGKALYRRIQRLPILHNQYLQNIDFQRSIRSLQALSFVPQGLVYSYFCMLLSTLEPTNELRDIVGIVNKHKHVLSYRIYSILHKYLDRSKTYYSTRESYLWSKWW